MFKFAQKMGKHSDKEGPGGSIRVHRPGEVFETKHDLRKWNSPGQPPKFELLDDPAPRTMLDASIPGVVEEMTMILRGHRD